MRSHAFAPFITLAVLAITVTACGSSPGSPTTSRTASTLPFVQGAYVLTLMGSDEAVVVAGGAGQPGCVGLAHSGIGNDVSTAVTMSVESGVWIGRPTTAAGGSFELRFASGTEGLGAPGGGPGVAVTASGVVLNTIPFPFVSLADTRVILSTSGQSPASFTGGVSRDGFVASGVTSSVVVMSNSAGTSVSCNAGAVSWSLSRSG